MHSSPGVRTVILDEPTAGMSVDEVTAILEVICKNQGRKIETILLIEHKINLISDLSDSVMVLYIGGFLAEEPRKNYGK